MSTTIFVIFNKNGDQRFLCVSAFWTGIDRWDPSES